MYVTRRSIFNAGNFSAGNFDAGNFRASNPLSAGIQQVFDRFLPVQGNDSGASSTSPRQWSPQVDIREDEQHFVILADIPGIDPQQIEVSMDKGVLSIRGTREGSAGVTASDDPTGKFTRVERAHGAFHRRFALPETADAESITASGSNGVLEISIPKKTLPTPRRITISSGH